VRAEKFEKKNFFPYTLVTAYCAANQCCIGIGDQCSANQCEIGELHNSMH